MTMRLSILLSVALLGSVTGRTTADAMTRLTALKSEALKDQANVEQDLEEKVLSERKAEEESQAQTLAKVCVFHSELEQDTLQGTLKLTVETIARKAPLDKAQQRANLWYNLHPSSPLKKSGLDAWIATADGFRFRGKKDDQDLAMSCKAMDASTVISKQGSMTMSFDCSKSEPVSEARFAQYPVSFWQPTIGGYPYGYSNGWGSTMSYPYYSVTPWGYYGCGMGGLGVTSLYGGMGGMCGNPYYYGWANLDYSVLG